MAALPGGGENGIKLISGPPAGIAAAEIETSNRSRAHYCQRWRKRGSGRRKKRRRTEGGGAEAIAIRLPVRRSARRKAGGAGFEGAERSGANG